MIKKILNTLETKNKKKFFFLTLSFFPLIFLETIGIGSIPVFVIFITQQNNLDQYFTLISLKELIENFSLLETVIYGSIFLAIIFFLKGIVTFIIAYFELKFIRDIMINTSTKIFKIYLNQDYYFHIQNNPAKLLENTKEDVRRSSSAVLSLLTLIKELMLLIVILSILIYSDPQLLLLIFILLSIPLILYYFFFKKILKSRGKIAKKYRTASIKIINQALSGIKFIKLIRNEDLITDSLKQNLFIAYRNEMFMNLINKTPKIFLEIFSLLILLTLIIFYINIGYDLNEFLPIISFMVVAAVRLIPSFGNIINSINFLKFNQVSVENVYKTLKIKTTKPKKQKGIYKNNRVLKNSSNGLIIKKLNFKYPAKENKIIDNASIKLNKNKIFGITGQSGSGKTTFIDLVLNLLKPLSGSITFNGKNIHNEEKKFMTSIGYVPQNVYLLDDTILNNITFGNEDKVINRDLLQKCIKFSQLENFINSLPKKLNTNIGHDGKKISGGQLQRIGIARALYQNPEIIVFDEATNALDIPTEIKLLKNLRKFKDDLTIFLISHRLSVLKKCDEILLIKNGKIKKSRLDINLIKNLQKN